MTKTLSEVFELHEKPVSINKTETDDYGKSI